MTEWQEKFHEVYTRYIHRTGSEELLSWLGQRDFFTAPASAKYHCACEGGLVMHSLNVYQVMRGRYFEEGDKFPKNSKRSLSQTQRERQALLSRTLY